MTVARTERNQPTAPAGGITALVRRASLVLLVCALGCGGEPRATPDTAMTADTARSVPADTASAAPVGNAPATPAEVTAFLDHVEARRAPDSARVTADATAEGLRLLAAAIEALAVRDTAAAATVRPRLDVLRARADSAQRDTLPAERARRAGEAFVLASELLQTLQDRTPPSLTDRAAEARQAAAAVRADQPLSQQPDAVRRFFERAAAALRGMAGATPTP